VARSLNLAIFVSVVLVLKQGEWEKRSHPLCVRVFHATQVATHLLAL